LEVVEGTKPVSQCGGGNIRRRFLAFPQRAQAPRRAWRACTLEALVERSKASAVAYASVFKEAVVEGFREWKSTSAKVNKVAVHDSV
jgi:hypothetical protein